MRKALVVEVAEQGVMDALEVITASWSRMMSLVVVEEPVEMPGFLPKVQDERMPEQRVSVLPRREWVEELAQQAKAQKPRRVTKTLKAPAEKPSQGSGKVVRDYNPGDGVKTCKYCGRGVPLQTNGFCFACSMDRQDLLDDRLKRNIEEVVRKAKEREAAGVESAEKAKKPINLKTLGATKLG
jgi:hypothetical protein